MRRIITYLTLLLIIFSFSSSALAEPRLWSVHNSYVTVGVTIGSDDYFKTDLSTAKFLNVDFEVVDDNAELPGINTNDRPSIPKMTIEGGNYSYFTGSLVEEVSGGSKTFEISRTDALTWDEDYKKTGYVKPGYTAANEEGDWIHFMFKADGGINGAKVTWPAYESLTRGSGTVPNFKTTKEQLDDIVPYIEYFGTQAEDYGEGWLAVEGFKWRFVKSSDVTKAVSTDVKITLQVIGSYNHSDSSWGEEYLSLGEAVTFEAGDILSGEVKFEKGTNDMPFQTVLRYYKNDNKDECYQWRFIPRNFTANEDLEGAVQLGTNGSFYVPLKNGKPDYKYTQYGSTFVGLIVYKAFTPEILADVGKAEMTISGGNYWLRNTDEEKIEDVSGARTYKLFSRTPLLDSYFEFGYLVPGYRKVHFTYINDAYSTRGVNFMDEGGTLGGQTISYSFPSEANSWINNSTTLPQYQSKEEILSSSSYIPYAEIVSKDNYITEIKFGLVKSPDLDGSKFVTPEHFTSISLYLTVWGEETTSLEWSNINNPLEDYNSHSWKLENHIKVRPEDAYSIGFSINIYPEAGPTWYDFQEWLGEGNSHLDASKCISYVWDFNNLPPVSPMSRLGDDFDNVADNIADSLSEDVSGILPVEREELGDETEFMLDVIDELEQTESVDVIGRFKQLNVTESGTFAVKVTLPDELYDEIEGAASADLIIYPITNSENENEDEGSSASVSSIRVRTSANKISSKGKLLASDGKTFNTIDTKEFILTVPLEKSANEDYTNYSLYLGLGSAKPQTPEEVIKVVSGDESQNIDPAVKAALLKLIDNPNSYDIKTFNEAAASGDITYYKKGLTPKQSTLDTISKDFNNFESIDVLPAFTLSVDKPIILIMKISADIANNSPLHLFTLKGTEIAGASRQFVKLSAAPDTSESKAQFFDGVKEIEKLSANTVYTASVFTSGNYLPLVITGEAKSDLQPEDPKDPSGDKTILGSSSGGCSSGLFASGALMLAVLMFVKKKMK